MKNYDFIVLATIIDKVLANEFPKIVEFNKYLNQIGSICTILGLPVIWSLPSGLIVEQKYMKSEAIELKPFKFNRTRFKLNKKNKEINLAKQQRALMPNLVHSLDAASLALLVDYFYTQSVNKNPLPSSGKVKFFAIHDCFATTCNNFENLKIALKSVYFLKNFKKLNFIFI